jgi:hypothetical protein
LQRPFVPCVQVESDVQHEGSPDGQVDIGKQPPGAGGTEHAPSPVRWLTGTRPPSTPPPLLLLLVDPPPLEPLLPPPLEDPLVVPLEELLVEPLPEPLLLEPPEPLLDPLLEPLPELPASGTAAAWPPQAHIRGRIAMRLVDLRMGEALRPRACATGTPRPRSARVTGMRRV